MALTYRRPQRLARWILGITLTYMLVVVVYVLIFKKPWLLLAAAGVLSLLLNSLATIFTRTLVDEGGIHIGSRLRSRFIGRTEVAKLRKTMGYDAVEIELKSSKIIPAWGVKPSDIPDIERILGLNKPGAS